MKVYRRSSSGEVLSCDVIKVYENGYLVLRKGGWNKKDFRFLSIAALNKPEGFNALVLIYMVGK